MNIGESRKIYAVDFDGTLVTNKFPKIGKPNIKLIKKLKELKKENNIIIIWTGREGNYLKDVVDFCIKYRLDVDRYNENYIRNDNYYCCNGRKIWADYYIDDKAVNVKDFI